MNHAISVSGTPKTIAPGVVPWGLACAATLGLTSATPGVLSHHNSDSLIHSLASTTEWTPFFWGQDRLGMLIPLTTSAIRDPLLNTILQAWISGALLYTGLFLLPLLVWPHWRSAAAGLLGGLLFSILQTDYIRWELTSAHPEWSATFGLGIAGLYMIHRGEASTGRFRTILGAILLSAALWINESIIAFAGPLAVGLYLFRFRVNGNPRPYDPGRPPRLTLGGNTYLQRLFDDSAIRSLVVSVSVLLAGWVALQGVTDMLALPSTHRNFDPGQVTKGLSSFLAAHSTLLNPRSYAGLSIPAVAALVCLPWIRRANRVAPAWRMQAPLVLAAGSYLLVVSGIEHVQANDFSPRYAAFAVFSLFVMAPQLLLASVPSRFDLIGRRLLAILASAFVLATAWFNLPDYAATRDQFDSKWGRHARAASDLGLTHVMGDYWEVWGTVYWTNYLFYHNAPGRVLHGIAHRDRPVRRLYRDVTAREYRIGVFQPLEKSLPHVEWLMRRVEPAALQLQRQSESFAIYGVPAAIAAGTDGTRIELARRDSSYLVKPGRARLVIDAPYTFVPGGHVLSVIARIEFDFPAGRDGRFQLEHSLSTRSGIQLLNRRFDKSSDSTICLIRYHRVVHRVPGVGPAMFRVRILVPEDHGEPVNVRIRNATMIVTPVAEWPQVDFNNGRTLIEETTGCGAASTVHGTGNTARGLRSVREWWPSQSTHDDHDGQESETRLAGYPAPPGSQIP